MSLDFDEARRQLRLMTQAIRAAEEDYRRAVETAADSEALYRIELGRHFRAARDAGEAVGSAEMIARQETAMHVRERDASAGHCADVVMHALERVVEPLVRPARVIGRHALKTDDQGLHLRPPKDRVAARGTADGRAMGSIRGLVDSRFYATTARLASDEGQQ